jgi:Protein of unknown function (DUF3631)
MPAGVEDRDADVWEALLGVADLAGGDWPKLARRAASELVKAAREIEPSLNILLLADLRTIFEGEERLSIKDVLARLCSLEDAPWNALKGKPITDNQLARRLKQYEVKPKTLRLERNVIAKGYAREDLHDVWRRYLPSPPDEPLTTVTDVTTQSFQDRGETGDALRASQEPLQPLRNASDGASVTKAVTACNVSIAPGKRQKIEDLTDVTPVTPSAEGGRASHRAERPAGMRAIGYDGALISPNPPRRRTRI